MNEHNVDHILELLYVYSSKPTTGLEILQGLREIKALDEGENNFNIWSSGKDNH